MAKISREKGNSQECLSALAGLKGTLVVYISAYGTLSVQVKSFCTPSMVLTALIDAGMTSYKLNIYRVLFKINIAQQCRPTLVYVYIKNFG